MECNNIQIYKEFENYDFNNDANFQSGLSSILNENKSKEEMESLVERAKWFYYSIVAQKFDYDDYLAWKSNESPISSSSVSEEKPMPSSAPVTAMNSENDNAQNRDKNETPQYPRSFAQLVEMISNNQPIPGIKKIPNEINKGTPSNPTLKPRPKPWEKPPPTTNSN
ncbi:11232_t:CDS:2 [Acaulospora colombiana]|uniref:11232_t:CDS:1 n=1 Tax=Acaulospora colombiana TaxID=27376 RepID=A0ACA9K293_9GLOM|nr:11232_t:CDS:2 [Acaulospora colombiana]